MPNCAIGGQIIGEPGETYVVTVELNGNNNMYTGLFGQAVVEIGSEQEVWVVTFDLPPDKLEQIKSACIRIRGSGGFREYHVRFVNNPWKTLVHTLTLLAEVVCRKRPGLLSTDFVGKFAWGGTYVGWSGRLLSANGFPLIDTATEIAIN